MKKLFFFFICALVWIAETIAQNCLPEGILFSNQVQVDEFQVNYPGCNTIEGDVAILGDNITNLDGLNVLVAIGGDLIIKSNEMLGELSGLSNLENLGGNLRIELNNVLSNLQGFENLSRINGDLIIGDIVMGQYPYSTGNQSLTSLTGLNNLVSIQGNFKLCGNYSLSSLSGLDNLVYIGGNFQLGGIEFVYGFKFGNPLLINLSGLSHLSAIGGSLFVAGNINLVNLSGLESLTSIGQNCWFDLNESLVTLQGLNQLTSIGGSLNIRWNKSLTDISSLENIAAQTIQDLEIFYNQSLSECNIKSICDYLAKQTGPVEISDNSPGCNSKAEVEKTCGIFGIEEFSHKKGISFYPNPSCSQITFKVSSIPCQVSISDLSGCIILNCQVLEPITIIDISKLPQGCYFVRVQEDKWVLISKFIKL